MCCVDVVVCVTVVVARKICVLFIHFERALHKRFLICADCVCVDYFAIWLLYGCVFWKNEVGLSGCCLVFFRRVCGCILVLYSHVFCDKLGFLSIFSLSKPSLCDCWLLQTCTAPWKMWQFIVGYSSLYVWFDMCDLLLLARFLSLDGRSDIFKSINKYIKQRFRDTLVCTVFSRVYVLLWKSCDRLCVFCCAFCQINLN